MLLPPIVDADVTIGDGDTEADDEAEAVGDGPIGV